MAFDLLYNNQFLSVSFNRKIQHALLNDQNIFFKIYMIIIELCVSLSVTLIFSNTFDKAIAITHLQLPF